MRVSGVGVGVGMSLVCGSGVGLSKGVDGLSKGERVSGVIDVVEGRGIVSADGLSGGSGSGSSQKEGMEELHGV